MDLGESDKIVTCLTRDCGKIKGVAKGAKRSQKRFGSGLELITHIDLGFFERERQGLVRIDRCQIIDSFFEIRKDLQKIAHASYFLELANEMVAERDENLQVYRLMVHALRLLDGNQPREELLRIFEIRFLALAGYQPTLDRCIACRSHLEAEDQSWFSLTRGGVVCPAFL
jgi:DNA repair protein RecO (recombination protein O)